MEKNMIQLFIYFTISLNKPNTKNFCLNKCIETINYASSYIRKKNLKEWDNLISKYFDPLHPLMPLQKDLMNLSQEEYLKTLEKSSLLLLKFKRIGERTNYNSLFVLNSAQSVEELAYKICLKSNDISQLKSLFKSIHSRNELNKEDLRKKMIILDEICMRYFYGENIFTNYRFAFKGWSLLYDKLINANYMLGLCYLYGAGTKKDSMKAYEIFSKIQDDDPRAKYEMAMMNYDGNELKQDFETASDILSSLKRNCSWDIDKDVDFHMGMIYFYGLGTVQDKEKGLSLMENAWNNRIALDYSLIKKVLKNYYETKQNFNYTQDLSECQDEKYDEKDLD